MNLEQIEDLENELETNSSEVERESSKLEEIQNTLNSVESAVSQIEEDEEVSDFLEQREEDLLNEKAEVEENLEILRTDLDRIGQLLSSFQEQNAASAAVLSELESQGENVDEAKGFVDQREKIIQQLQARTSELQKRVELAVMLGESGENSSHGSFSRGAKKLTL